MACSHSWLHPLKDSLAFASGLAGLILSILAYLFKDSNLPVRWTIVVVTVVSFVVLFLLANRSERDAGAKSVEEPLKKRRPRFLLMTAFAITSLIFVASFSLHGADVADRPVGVPSSGPLPPSPITLMTPRLPLEPGVVAGAQIQPSPTLHFAGSGCADTSREVHFTLANKYRDVIFRAALDDSVDESAHIQLQVDKDGVSDQRLVVERGSGVTIHAEVGDVADLTVNATALSHTTRACSTTELPLHIFDVVVH